LADAAAARGAIERDVAELERLCGELERSLVAGDWNAVANALRSSRRATHSFLNSMEAGQTFRDEAFDRTVTARMRRVFDVREDQLERLRTFNAGVGQRLRQISRWNTFARETGSKRAPARTAGFDATQ